MYKRMGPKSHKQYVKEGEANPSSYTIKEETDPHLIIPRGKCTRPRRKLRNTGIESLLMRRDQFG